MDVEQLLEVEAGRAQPTTIGLSPGDPVGPLSIGRMGGWRVAANGVAAEHGWFYFDGRQLYLQSVDLSAPLYVDGQPVPATWTPVHAPCTIALGAARISFIAAAEEIERTADKFPAPATRGAAEPPRPPTPRSSARPFAPGELAHRPDAGDETKMGAIDVVAARARANALARPSMPRASDGAAPATQAGAAPQPQPAPGASTPSAGPRPDAAPQASPIGGAPAATSAGAGAAPLGDRPTTIQAAQPASGVLARFREASLPQKATVFLLPLALASVYVIFTEPPQGTDETATEDAAATGADAAASTPSSDPPDEASSAPSATISAAPITATPTTEAAPTAAPTAAAGTIEAAPDPAPAPASPPVVARAGSPVSRTLERRAADSVAAGDWEGAALLYEQLARLHPDRPAFAEAARIMRSRAR
jgi:hypothetical protein